MRTKFLLYKRRLHDISWNDPDRRVKIASIIFMAAKNEAIDLKTLASLINLAFDKIGRKYPDLRYKAWKKKQRLFRVL